MKYVIDTKEFPLHKVQLLGVDKYGVCTATLNFDTLEELNSDYINEHFGDLQDDAYERGHGIGYQKGFEDGKAVHDKGCEGCKHEGISRALSPCHYCTRNTTDYWTAKQTDDRIEVGDEVRGTSGTEKYIVTAIDSEFVRCVVMTKRGGFFMANLSSLVKTGRHFDIASILKEMQS